MELNIAYYIVQKSKYIDNVAETKARKNSDLNWIFFNKCEFSKTLEKNIITLEFQQTGHKIGVGLSTQESIWVNMPSAIFLDWKLPHYVALRFEQRALKVRKFQREIVVPLILLEKTPNNSLISAKASKKWK